MASILPNNSTTTAVTQRTADRGRESGLSTVADLEPIISKPLTKSFPVTIPLVQHNGAGSAAYLASLELAAPLAQNRLAQHIQHASSVRISNLRLHFLPSSALAQGTNCTVGWGVRSSRDPLAAFPSITECVTAPQGGQLALALAGQWAYNQSIDINLEVAGITGQMNSVGLGNTGTPVFRFFVSQSGTAAPLS